MVGNGVRSLETYSKEEVIYVENKKGKAIKSSQDLVPPYPNHPKYM